MNRIRLVLILFSFLLVSPGIHASEMEHGTQASEIHFPIALEDYKPMEQARAAELGVSPQDLGLFEILKLRAAADPTNWIATLLFFGAILHTFFAGSFMKLAHQYEREHREKLKGQSTRLYVDGKEPVSFKSTLFHFLGEIEAVFGIWLIPLFLLMTINHGWDHVTWYIDHRNYTEPLFVFIIMAMAASRPVVAFAEKSLSAVAGIGKHTPAAWWISILIIAPLLGSFITEPAAMTIAALLLAHQFYRYQPSPAFKYATMGLLFVNVSVGGTLTHFAAPPVLMVAGKWGWDMAFMFEHFGWRAVLGICVSTLIYLVIFRRNFGILKERAAAAERSELKEEPAPNWIIIVHLAFLAWTVFTLHHPALFIGGFLAFIAFTRATEHHQYGINLKGPLLVGFFLAGLVTHGGLQGWWISPVLSSLGEIPLFFGATILTAFNDNAAITYLASQVPAFDQHMAADTTRALALQYAVLAGAVSGGGLTVIANAPNPAGQSILNQYFDGGVSPLKLLLGALVPTLVICSVFMLFPHSG